MESVTPRTCPASRGRQCAQRLPASWNRSLFLKQHHHHHLPCSTPSGIMESVTLSRPPVARRLAGCAQRLPASWNRSLDRNVYYDTGATVLNAFRHHGIGHDFLGRPLDEQIACSTPSGIMESVTPPWSRPCCTKIKCSTPSGIMESVTRNPASAHRAPKCAQRLPASWNRSQSVVAQRQHAFGLCSTPSGIMESVTSTSQEIAAPLSACSTPSGIMESVTTVGFFNRCKFFAVLNAFRHHGIGHSHNDWCRSGHVEVLNAFRHHGIGHAKWLAVIC